MRDCGLEYGILGAFSRGHIPFYTNLLAFPEIYPAKTEMRFKRFCCNRYDWPDKAGVRING